MILTHRLVRLVETHSDDLAETLLLRIPASSVVPSYNNVPSEKLKTRAKEIYEHLGQWMCGSGEGVIRESCPRL